MPCIPNDHVYGGVDLTDYPWSNWAETVRRTIPRYFVPASRVDLVDVARRATAAGVELHATGSGFAFEDVAISADWVVSLDLLNQSLTEVLASSLTDARRAKQDAPAGSERLFHVEAGIKIVDLTDALAAAGLAMPTLGGANGQGLAGAVSTSTHGGDIGLPPLADLVQAVHVVTVGGQELWIERSSEPVTTDARLRPVLNCPELRIVRDDELLHAAVVACGRFGIIYSMVVRVVPAFRLAEYTLAKPTALLMSALRDGIDAGTGVTQLLADLAAPPPALAADTPESARFLEVVIPSQRTSSCWIRRRWTTTDPTDLHPSRNPNPLCAGGMADVVLLTAAQALDVEAVHLALIPLVGLVWASDVALRAHFLRLAVGTQLTSGEATSMAVNAAWDSGLGPLIPHLNGMLVGGQFSESASSGRVGPSHLIMTGTRAANADCYRARSTEVMFPATTPAYLDYLAVLMALAPAFRQAGYISLRYSAPSRALISMHNLDAPIVVSIEVAVLAGIAQSREWVAFAERTAVAHGGRPHWGQEHHLTGPEVEQLYGDRLERWREALRSVSGTARTFSNDFTRRCGLEPAPVPRAATVQRVIVSRFPLASGSTPAPETETVFEPAQFAALDADLGDLEVGQSRLCDVELENAGETPLVVSVGGVTGNLPPAELRVEPTSPAATGERALVALLFSPSRPGPVSGELTLRTNAGTTPELRVRVHASPHGQRMSVDQPRMDLGSPDVGASAAQVLRLRNAGDREGTLIGVALADEDDPGAFSVQPDSASVAAGAAVELTVRYAPTRAGAARARLLLQTRRGVAPRQTLEVELSGEALAPVAELKPPSLTFGVVAGRRVSPWQGFEVSNRGTGFLRIAARGRVPLPLARRQAPQGARPRPRALEGASRRLRGPRVWPP